jgi:hypothetical protein
MKTYHVIWRGDEDEFFITRLDLEEGHIDNLSNQQVVEMCHDVEYPDADNAITQGATYEMIDIIGGDVTFHMK